MTTERACYWPECRCSQEEQRDGRALCATAQEIGGGTRITHRQARVMLDSLDDYARMAGGVNAIGPRTTLERYIAQQEADDEPRYELTDAGREALGGGK